MGVLKYKNEDGQWIKQTVLINVDQEMSDSSTGAVANKVIKTYVDSNDTSSLNTAKSYADTKDSEVKSYADSKDTETLNTAKGYTDTKTAQITADIYTKSEVDSKDTETLNSAKSYADTKASAAETNAKSYADTKDTETLNTAKSYTDTKTSEISGNTYTKSEVDGKLSEKQGKLTAGENITISDDNVISASGGSGSSTFKITFTEVAGEEHSVLSDKTAKEIYDAYVAGKYVYASYGCLSQIPLYTAEQEDRYNKYNLGFKETTIDVDGDYVLYILGNALSENDKNFVMGTEIFDRGSTVSASSTGTSTNEVSYITIDDTEYKIAGGGSSDKELITFTIEDIGEYTQEGLLVTVTSDNTPEQVITKYNEGKNLVFRVLWQGDYTYFPGYSISDNFVEVFGKIYPSGPIFIDLFGQPGQTEYSWFGIARYEFIPDEETIKASPLQGFVSAATATSSSKGIVQPDNTTITIEDGVISAVGGTSQVSSVNGKTGTVVLKTTDIENDSNYVTAAHHDSSKVDTSLLGAINGVATLNSQGKVLDSQLPDYMDDVVEGYYFNSKFYKDASHTEEIAGTSGKLYLDTVTSKLYRYSGSSYTEISGGSGASYSAGNGINIADNTISAKVDNNTIKVNSSGQLYTEESGSIATDSYHTTTTFGNDIPMDITFTKYGKVIDLTIQAVSPFYMKVIEKEGIPTWTNNKYKGEYITAGRDGAVVPWEIYTASDATIAYALYPFADGTTGHIRGLYKEPSKFTESSGVITKEEAVIYDEINHVYWTRTWTYTSGVKPDTFTDGSTKSFTYNKTPGSYVGTNQYGLFVDDIVEVPDWAHPATSNATVQGKHLIFNQFDGERELQVGLLTDNASVTCVHKFYMTLGYDTYNETFADDGTPIHTPLETPKVRLCGSYIRGITMDSTDMETINMMRTDLYKDMTFHITYIAQ